MASYTNPYEALMPQGYSGYFNPSMVAPGNSQVAVNTMTQPGYVSQRPSAGAGLTYDNGLNMNQVWNTQQTQELYKNAKLHNPSLPPLYVLDQQYAGNPTGLQALLNQSMSMPLPPLPNTTGSGATTAPTPSVPPSPTPTSGSATSSTGTEFQYPMNPLGDLTGLPNIMSQLALLTQMMSPSNMQGVLNPFMNNALQSIGRSGLPESTYADKTLAETINNAYYLNQGNLLQGLNNISSQLAGLTPAYLYPYDQQLEMISKVLLG